MTTDDGTISNNATGRKSIFTRYKLSLVLSSIVVVTALAAGALVYFNRADPSNVIAARSKGQPSTIKDTADKPDKDDVDQIAAEYLMGWRKVDVPQVVTKSKQLKAYGAAPEEIKIIESYPFDRCEPEEVIFAEKLARYLNNGTKWRFDAEEQRNRNWR